MIERREILIQGTVQGVGFRPFVHGLATGLGLGGFIRNRNGSVRIEIEGEAARLELFLGCVVGDAPPLARVESVTSSALPPRGEKVFRIEASEGGAAGAVAVAADAATCEACLRELFDPGDRRFGYPFLNCTNCGPRLTIVTGAPYDRQRTTMAGFAMCAACRAEYENPADRRFHAQPIACAVCGPRLWAMDECGMALDGDPLACVVAAIAGGKIAAIKGLGGYHLVCSATDGEAVGRLRSRKQREEKPFAVMVADVAAAEALCAMDVVERGLLTSRRRPVVLLRRHGRAGRENPFRETLPNGRVSDISVPDIADQVAPGNPMLGMMLPYTPLHHLLVRGMNGVPLVMTSGNRSDEPIAIDEADAVTRLRGIADVFLAHNRPIHVRCDDSVTRVIAGVESPVRRSRGMAPESLRISWPRAEGILAVGGQLKSTFALGGDQRAVVSHHLGDLDHVQAFGAFEKDIALYERLFSHRTVCLAHDLHPDYASTRYARRRAAEENLPLVAVQHHHAHMASCMAEHGLAEPVIGVVFDGAGYGTDGTIWGGEFLVGDYARFERAAHLRHVPMPGADQAARQPWRMAASYLINAEAGCPALERRMAAADWRTLHRMVERRFNSPMTSSMGRLFDAVASLAGVRDATSYEGQAAAQLEWLATDIPPDGAYPITLEETDGGILIDARPLIRAVAQDVQRFETAARISRRFHTAIVEMIRAVCVKLRASHGRNAVVLTGGVFMNALLATEAKQTLDHEGFRVYSHRQVPTNDGGLCLGQLAIAANQEWSR